MSRYRAIYDRQGLLAEYLEDEIIYLRNGANTHNTSGPQVVRDINPYKSMIDGQVISSRSHHRDHLKRHGCIEVGNDTSHMKAKPPTPKRSSKQMLASLLGDKSDRQVSAMIRDEIRKRQN